MRGRGGRGGPDGVPVPRREDQLLPRGAVGAASPMEALVVRFSLILRVLGAPLVARSAAGQVPPEHGVSVSAAPLVPLTPGSQDTARACNPRALPGVIWWGPTGT